MKKEYKDYFEIIKKLNVREVSISICVSEDLVRKYFRGETYPRLPTAVILEKNYSIPCEYWIINQQKKGKKV